MRSAAELASFILGSLREEEAGRVALYHYLKNFHQPHEFVTSDLINQFFSECLQLPHWQEKREELGKDIHDLIQRFFSQSGTTFNLDQLWNLARIQVFPLNQIENLYLTVKNHEQSRLREGDSLKLIPDGENRVVSIHRASRGEVTVRAYGNWVRIQGHVLLPLGPDQEIFYDSGLELQQGRTQRMRPAPHSQARFVIGPTSIEAQFVSGMAFRQTQALSLSALSQEPRLFYPLKKLERLYVHRPSDPFYVEIIGTLDKALNLLQTDSDGAETFARQAFEGGQIAFDQIFPDDKALYSRLRELAKQISY